MWLSSFETYKTEAHAFVDIIESLMVKKTKLTKLFALHTMLEFHKFCLTLQICVSKNVSSKSNIVGPKNLSESSFFQSKTLRSSM